MGIVDASESSSLYFYHLSSATRQWEGYTLAPKKSDTNKQGIFLVYVFIKPCGCDQPCEDGGRTCISPMSLQRHCQKIALCPPQQSPWLVWQGRQCEYKRLSRAPTPCSVGYLSSLYPKCGKYHSKIWEWFDKGNCICAFPCSEKENRTVIPSPPVLFHKRVSLSKSRDAKQVFTVLAQE